MIQVDIPITFWPVAPAGPQEEPDEARERHERDAWFTRWVRAQDRLRDSKLALLDAILDDKVEDWTPLSWIKAMKLPGMSTYPRIREVIESCGYHIEEMQSSGRPSLHIRTWAKPSPKNITQSLAVV